jgi:YQGE family putative transporter
MPDKKLHPQAWVALLLHGLFAASEALCSIFVGVYFYLTSGDIGVVWIHYFILYVITPIFFALTGWYSQRHDRLHAYRFGLLLHVVYYAAILWLREDAASHPWSLGVLLGVTWGIYYGGANSFNFDVTQAGKREYYFGLMHSVTGFFRLVAPLVGGLLIAYTGAMSADETTAQLIGYHLVFLVAIVLYLGCFFLSFKMPKDAEPRTFKLKRALFPSKDQRDWQWIMFAAFSQAGMYSIFTFLLGLLMYLETDDALSVGGYASLQALGAIIVAYFLGRSVKPATRKKSMLVGVVLLVGAGLVLAAFELTWTTLLVFGVLRAFAGPFFGIPHFGLRLDIIAKSAEEPAQRIEYLCAWEVPLALGRIVMMLTILGLYFAFDDKEIGLRLSILVLCCMRILTFWSLCQTEELRGGVVAEREA